MPKSKPNKHKKSKKKQSNYRRPPKEKTKGKDIVAGLCLIIIATIRLSLKYDGVSKFLKLAFNEFIVIYTPSKIWLTLSTFPLMVLIIIIFYKKPSKSKKVYIILLTFYLFIITVIHFAKADIWIFDNDKIQKYNYAGTCEATYSYNDIVKVDYDWREYMSESKYSTYCDVYAIVFDDETKVDVYEVECTKKDDDSFEVFRNRMEMYISE